LRRHCATPPFAIILRPPPTPTLFPYTTLFRSNYRGTRQLSKRSAGFEIRVGEQPRKGPRRRARQRDPLDGLELCGHSNGLRTSRDRKSTRLNSSHVSISYAVFCLKKKKSTTMT